MIYEFINFYIIDNNDNKVKLDNPTCTITVENGVMYKNQIMHQTRCSAAFLIIMNDNAVQIHCLLGDICVDGASLEPGTPRLIKDGSSIIVGTLSCYIKIDYDESHINDLIDAYMRDELRLPISLDTLFLNYAKQLKITDKTAISAVMATIDIPEIDTFESL